MPNYPTRALHLNLGCSDAHEEGFTNVDSYHGCHPDIVADLTLPWPWEDNTVEVIRAWDIFEHLPDKIFTLNEAWRVLKPNGRLDMIVPTTDGRGAFQDPTHKSYWNPNSLFYATYGNAHNTRFAKAYGIKHVFRITHKTHDLFADQVWKLHAIMEAIK